MNYSNEQLKKKKEDAIKEAEKMNRQNSPPKGNTRKEGNSIFSLFDNDSILIFVLIMLLLKENKGNEIILALLYIFI